MTFPEAMAQVIEGRKVTRLEWNNGDHCFLGTPYLSIFRTAGGKEHQWLVNDGDMKANDWVLVTDKN